MNREIIEQEIIKILITEFGKQGDPAWVPTKNVAEQLNIPIEEITNVIKIMYSIRKIDATIGLKTIRITPEKYEEYRDY